MLTSSGTFLTNTDMGFHAAILAVVIPMLVAPVIMLFKGQLARIIAIGTAISSLIFSVILLQATRDGSILSYHLGGWVPPLGIEYRVDSLNATFMTLVSLMAVMALIFGTPLLKSCVSEHRHPTFFTSFLICLTGGLGVCATGDAFNIFVFLEVSSLATYAMIIFGSESDRRALPATFNYLIMGTIGATFFVIGVGFLYAATGSLNLVDISIKLQEIGDTKLVRVGLAFVLVGLGIKTAMFPLHHWLPGAYASAPNLVTIFLSATATKFAFYVFLRFLYLVFDTEQSMLDIAMRYIIGPLAVIGMIVGSARAIAEPDLKRLFAYSSVAQVGYFLLGASLGTQKGVAAALWHLINHAFMKSALFMALGLMAWHIGVRTLSDLRGMGKRMPWTMAGMIIAGFSLFGLPLTAGFLSKFALLEAAWDQNYWLGVAAIGLSSVFAFVYLGKIVESAYFKTSSKTPNALRPIPVQAAFIFWLMVSCNILFGLHGKPIQSIADRAAQALFTTESTIANTQTQRSRVTKPHKYDGKTKNASNFDHMADDESHDVDREDKMRLNDDLVPPEKADAVNPDTSINASPEAKPILPPGIEKEGTEQALTNRDEDKNLDQDKAVGDSVVETEVQTEMDARAETDARAEPEKEPPHPNPDQAVESEEN